MERLGQLRVTGRGGIRLERGCSRDERRVDGELVDGLGHRSQGYEGRAPARSRTIARCRFRRLATDLDCA